MPLVDEEELLELRLETLQGAVVIDTLAGPDSGAGCDAVQPAVVRSWLLPNGTWLAGMDSAYGNASQPLVQPLLARATTAAWTANGGARVPVADVSVGERAFRLPPWSVLTQTATTEPGQRYQLQFLVAVESRYPGARQGRRLTVDDAGDGASPVVKLTFEARHPGLQSSETWTRHTVNFKARQVSRRIALSTLPWTGAAFPLLVGQPTLVACDAASGSETGVDASVVDIGAAVQGVSDALVASWSLVDDQSQLEDVMGAIGTSPGGTQLQEFAPAPHTWHGDSIRPPTATQRHSSRYGCGSKRGKVRGAL